MSIHGDILNALADPTRRSLLEALAAEPRSVGALAEDVPVSRPAVSQHLRVLKEVGLVEDVREGTRRIYRVVPKGLLELRAYIDGFWDEVLTGFESRVAKEDRDG